MVTIIGEIENAYGVQRVVAGRSGRLGSCEFLWVLVGFGLGALSPLEPIRTYQNLLFFSAFAAFGSFVLFALFALLCGWGR